MIIFKGNEKYAYRDPACYLYKGVYHLFFTVSEKDSGYMYNRIGMSKSKDLKSWSDIRILTEKDYNLNYCSPGNIIPVGDEYVMCFTSYPMPYSYNQCCMADDTARLFVMKTKDFETFTKPEMLNPKGNTPHEELGRMIDPYIVEHQGWYHLFFKQNGVSFSRSQDLKTWEFMGNTSGGENVCVIKRDKDFVLVHSPANGISFEVSDTLGDWKNLGHTTLNQSGWDWASGRLTAGFAMELGPDMGYKYALFFHGSVDVYPETHGNATLAVAFTNDFCEFFYEL